MNRSNSDISFPWLIKLKILYQNSICESVLCVKLFHSVILYGRLIYEFTMVNLIYNGIAKSKGLILLDENILQ